MSKYSHTADIQAELSEPTKNPTKTMTFYVFDEYTESMYFKTEFKFQLPVAEENQWNNFILWWADTRWDVKELMERRDFGELKYMIHCNDPEVEKMMRDRQVKEMLVSRKRC